MSQISPDLLRHHGLDHYFGQQGLLSHSITSLSMPSTREEQIASRRQYIQETLVAKVSKVQYRTVEFKSDVVCRGGRVF